MTRGHTRARGYRPRALQGLALLIAMPTAAWCAAQAPFPAGGSHRTAAVRAPAPSPTITTTIPAPRQSDSDWSRIIRRREAARRRQERAKRDMVVAQLHADQEQTLERIAQRIAQWDALAQCESASHWNIVDQYGGGLGIYIGTWHAFGGDQFASNPGYATKEQQIIVAERVYARFGFSGWGCARNMGWVR